MISSPRDRRPFSHRDFSLTAALGLLVAVGCSSSSSPSGTGGQVGTGGSASGGATGTGGAGTGGTGTGGTSVGTGGAGTGGISGTGGAGAGGSATGGSATGGGGGSAGAVGRGGSGGLGGGAGRAATGGAGGATSCAGNAVAFNANVSGGGDVATAQVRVAASTALPTANQMRTIEFWAFVRSSSWVADANTMFFYGSNNRNADGFGFDFGTTAGGTGTIDPFTNNGATDPLGDNKPSGLMANVDQWAHFAMTWDGMAVRGFVNGVERATVPIPTGLNTTQMPLIIGGYPPAFFNGYIDEFRIWNVAHTAAQITATMHSSLAGNEAGLVGYWKFDETTGTTAADSVAAGHPGTLMANTATNLPTFVPSTAPIVCP